MFAAPLRVGASSTALLGLRQGASAPMGHLSLAHLSAAALHNARSYSQASRTSIGQAPLSPSRTCTSPSIFASARPGQPQLSLLFRNAAAAASAASRCNSSHARNDTTRTSANSSQPVKPAPQSSSTLKQAESAVDAAAAKVEASSSSPSSASLASRLGNAIKARLQEQMAKSAPKTKDGTQSPTPVATFPDMKRLIGLAMPQKRTMLIALALLLVSSCISLTIPAAIGRVIDFFTSGQSSLFGFSFGTVAFGMLFVFAIGAGAKAGSNILLELAGVRVVQGIRGQAYRSALRQDVELADKGAGDTVSRLSVDTNIVGDSLTSDIGDGLRAGVTVIFAGTAMFLLSAKLTLLMMAVVPPAAIGAVFYGRYLRDLTHKTQDAVGAMTRLAEERLSPPAFRTLTSFNTQRQEAKRFDAKVQDIVALQTKEAYASGLFYAGTGFVGNCAILTLLTYGGHLASRGEISVGDLTSLLMYTAYLGGGMISLTSFFASVMKGVGAGARVFELIDRESNVRLGAGDPLPVPASSSSSPLSSARSKTHSLPIRFDNVHFSYPSRPQQKILDGVSLSIEPGKSYALVGGSGAGKSSVHALLLRYYDPDSGRILLGNRDLRELKVEEVRKAIAVVPQEPVLFDGTVEENITYGTDNATREDVERVIQMAGCGFIHDLSDGLATRIGARQLSGGQRQRIAIARALVKNPSILLLDEATSALDSASEVLVNRAIEEIIQKGEITVWIVAHRLSTIKSAKNLQVLERGRIVEQGTYDELDRPGTRFRKLMAAQLEAGAAEMEHAEDEDGEVQQADETQRDVRT
ncbi:probable ATP-binding cassette (ABC) transporter [Pseudozyma flocculosa]|uniref:Probable ATP-binding cassette (ABC) transporter n=1 Tax=Pseudozyma flocculosa TaxID=84751 RepID=A0A5C3EZC5_9BASI|nr:probable ATP-binding cassette (ABC) transporter [Pseudozyma flocculosa]